MIIVVSVVALCGISVLIGLRARKINPTVHQKADRLNEKESVDNKSDEGIPIPLLTRNQHILETNEYVLDTWEKLKELTKIDLSRVAIQSILYYKHKEYDGSVLIVVFSDEHHEISSYYQSRDLYDQGVVDVAPLFVELFNRYHIDIDSIVDESIDFAEVVHRYSYTPFEAVLKYGIEIQDIDPDMLNGYEYIPYTIEWFQIKNEKNDENCMIVVTYPFAIKVDGVFLDYISHSYDTRR